MLVVPAVSEGLKGSGLWHALPFGPVLTLNVDEDSVVPFSAHGVNVPVVVYEPHNAGVLNGARSPPKKCSSTSSKGTCGKNCEDTTPPSNNGSCSKCAVN